MRGNKLKDMKFTCVVGEVQTGSIIPFVDLHSAFRLSLYQYMDQIINWVFDFLLSMAHVSILTLDVYRSATDKCLAE